MVCGGGGGAGVGGTLFPDTNLKTSRLIRDSIADCDAGKGTGVEQELVGEDGEVVTESVLDLAGKELLADSRFFLFQIGQRCQAFH